MISEICCSTCKKQVHQLLESFGQTSYLVQSLSSPFCICTVPGSYSAAEEGTDCLICHNFK